MCSCLWIVAEEKKPHEYKRARRSDWESNAALLREVRTKVLEDAKKADS